MDEPEPQHAYDFFAPGPLPCYAGNPNNTNGWIEEDVSLLGELGKIGKPLGAEVDEPLVDPVIDELAEPIVEVEEQMVTLVMDMKEDLAMLFRVEEGSSDDDFEGPEGNEKVGGSSTATAEGHSLTLFAPRVLVLPSVNEDLCTRMGNLEYGHRQLVKKVITVSDAEVADSIAIREIGPRVSTVEGQMHVMASQMVKVVNGLEQTLVAEMSSRKGTLIQCILGLDRRLANVETRPPGPQ
ncbi:hypothetical protein Tco_0367958 [Tanacetum coccineum]